MTTQNTRKRVIDFAFLVALAGIWFVIGWIGRGWFAAPDDLLLEQTRQALLSSYPYVPPADRELTYGAIRGMLRRSGDPHAALIVPPISQRFQDDFDGQSGVIGLFPERHGEEMIVSVVFPGDPADRAGLRVGDVILSVDDIPFDEEITAAEASMLIRGPVGVPAHFVVRRGEQVLTFDPVRKERTIVTSNMLDGDIGYLAQYTFTANAPEKVEAALRELLAQHPKGLIWDLRSNGGGSMDAAQAVLSMFINEGVLFQAELQDGSRETFLAFDEGVATDLPLVVLIGERTYSSAETSAAAILERQRGVLIGGVTYGKGTIQTTAPLSEDTLLQYTIAKWLSPSGTWYDGQGVKPDIAISDDPATMEDEVMRFALDYLRRGGK